MPESKKKKKKKGLFYGAKSFRVVFTVADFCDFCPDIFIAWMCARLQSQKLKKMYFSFSDSNSSLSSERFTPDPGRLRGCCAVKN